MKAIIKRLVLTATLAGLSAIGVQAQRVTYAIDPAHSEVDFGIKHMGISTVHGRFPVSGGSIELDEKNLASSSVEATIDVAGVDTGVAQRDTHLKSPDFFDTAKFPTATFKSTRIVQAGDGYDVVGDLNLHGVTKPVTLHMDAPSKEQIYPDKKAHRGFSATAMIHRQDFGLTWNGTLKSGDTMLGDDVKLTFDVEGAQK